MRSKGADIHSASIVAKSVVCINGEEVATATNTLTEYGMIHIGNRMLVGTSSALPMWTLYTFSTGDVTLAHAYSEITGGDPYHQYFVNSADNIGAGDWTGMKLLNTNTTTPSAAQTYATMTFSAVTKAVDDTLDAYWRFFFDGADFTSVGFSRGGHLAFDNAAHGFSPFNYVSVRELDNTEWKRAQATPTLDGSNQYFATYDATKTFTPDASNPQVDRMRLYDAASSGEYLCELTTTPTVPQDGDTFTAAPMITLIN